MEYNLKVIALWKVNVEYNLKEITLQKVIRLFNVLLVLFAFIKGGPLLTYLRGNETSLTTKKRTEMCRDVAKGMAYLHKDKFIHR